MIEVLGINADWPQWLLTTVQCRPDLRAFEDSDVSPRPLPNLPDGFFCWARQQTEPLLQLAQASQSQTDLVERTLTKLRTAIRRAHLAQIYQEHLETWGPPEFLGLVHPYSASPLVRRVLPVLLDGDFIAGPSSPAFARPPAQCLLAGRVPVSAIDAPSAGCLDLVAKQELPPPASLLLLTGPPADSELTAVRVERVSDELKLQFQVTIRLDSRLPFLPPEVHRSLRAASTAGNSRLVYFGQALRPTAEQIAGGIGESSLTVHGAEPGDLALGAARYAVLCGKGELPGAEVGIRRLRIEHISPHPLGVACVNDKGAWFWRRMVRAGEPLMAATSRLSYSGALPERLLVAESGSFGVPGWVTQADWEKYALRLFAFVCPEPLVGRAGSAVQLRVVNPSGSLAYGWSDPAVRVEVGF